MNDPKAVTLWSRIEGIDALAELALNLHWSWNHAADELWEHLDSELWEDTQNPWVILQTVSRDKIQAALTTPKFRKRLEDLLRQNRESYTAGAWFQKKHPRAPLTVVAYFSMEFMLSEALPIYSGGLGNVAGDQPEFSANRTIREYTSKHYLPAAASYHERASSEGTVGASLVQWQRDVASHNSVQKGKPQH